MLASLQDLRHCLASLPFSEDGADDTPCKYVSFVVFYYLQSHLLQKRLNHPFFQMLQYRVGHRWDLIAPASTDDCGGRDGVVDDVTPLAASDNSGGDGLVDDALAFLVGRGVTDGAFA